jgi:dephospho-CoA kinase
LRIIGLTGVARSGKDSVAAVIQGRLGWHRESFARPIREFVAGLLGLTLEELEIHKEKPMLSLSGVTPRQMMQTLGTEWGRSIHPHLWIRALFHRLERNGLLLGAQGVVITDCRFDNEARAIHNAGGEVWLVQRPGAGSAFSAHASERGVDLDLVDRYVMNSGSLEDLRKTVEAFL